MQYSMCLFYTITILLTLSSTAHPENWGQWRGPHFNGTANETDLPEKWTRSENVAWAADLPGPSAATPVVWNDHVFVSSVDVERNKLVALCIDRKTGKRLWSHDISDGIRRDSRSTYSSPSPATDGEVVVFFYGNGEMVTFDFAGNLIWRRNIQEDYGEFAFLWTFSSSPVLYGDKLILQVLQRDTAVDGRGFEDRVNESYILALDPKSGDELWRYIRPSKARSESREAFTTPVPHTYKGQEQLLVVGGDALTAHNLDDGTEIWRWGTWNPQRITHWRHVPSPVAGGDVVLVCAPKREPVYAIKNGGKGELNADAIAWISRDNRAISSDVPTPAFYDGDFFILSDVRKTLSRVDPATGQPRWQVRTPGDAKYEASPTVADGKIYIVNFVGDVVVFDANDGKIINRVSMDEPGDDAVRSTIVVSNGQLFIRTNRKLFCIGKK